ATVTGNSDGTSSFTCASTVNLDANTYSVTAVFTPSGATSTNLNYTYGGSTSPALSLTVTTQVNTPTTALNTITSSVIYNAENQTFSGTVLGTSGDGDPVGSVSVFAGTTLLCSATVTGNSDGTSSFTCASTVNLDANTYSVTAVLTPSGATSTNLNYTYGGSPSPALSLTVTTQVNTPTTALNTITSSVIYNAENQTFSGTVLGTSGDGDPVGSVSVFAGTTLLCSATVTGNSDGTSSFTCASTVNLDANTYSVTAVFTPSGATSTNLNYTYGGSTSPALSLTVTTQVNTTTTALNTITSSVIDNAENQTFSGTVLGTSGDGDPVGSVSVFAGTTLLCSATVTGNSDGTSSFTCASTVNLDANTYSVTAVFTPSGATSTNLNYTYGGSTSPA